MISKLRVLKYLLAGLIVSSSLTACTEAPVPQRNGFVATLTGDLRAELSSGEMQYADVIKLENGFAISTDSFDFETGLDFRAFFSFVGDTKAGDYRVTSSEKAAPQTVSIQLDPCAFYETCSADWKSVDEGTVTFSEVSETKIVGAFDLPLVLGQKKTRLTGTLYLLPLPMTQD